MLARILFLAVAAIAVPASAGAECASERAAMVNTIRAHARSGPPISERVLQAMGETARHRLIPQPKSCTDAYADRPLPIGRGQTISQPYIVALMTELAAAKPADTVLEIGTGSGYQAAILSRLARRVCTVEIAVSYTHLTLPTKRIV